MDSKHSTYAYVAGCFEGFDYYQAKCNETAIFPEDLAIEYLTLGLVSEAGEVAGKVKKKIRDGERPDHVKELSAELGDVFWYLAMLTDRLGLNVSDVLFDNMTKLALRKQENTLQGSGDNR